MTRLILSTVLALALIPASWSAAQEPPQYGMPISLAQAKAVMAAAEVAADQQGWPVAIAIVDTHGVLVMFQRLENTQYGSVRVALDKAKTAAMFRRETKIFEDVIAQGGSGLRLLSLPGALPLEGGLPIIVDGKVVGGIGVSGVRSEQDAEVCRAGLEALQP